MATEAHGYAALAGGRFAALERGRVVTAFLEAFFATWVAYGFTLDVARALLALPREVGPHPQTGEPILAGIGRFGPWVRHGETYASLGEDDDVLTVGLNRAVALLAEKAVRQSRSRGRKRTLRELGAHPADGAPVWLKTGHYGPLVAHRHRYASLPEEIAPDALTLDRALALLARARGAAGRGAGTAEEGWRDCEKIHLSQ